MAAVRLRRLLVVLSLIIPGVAVWLAAQQPVGATTIDGQSSGDGPLLAGTQRDLIIAGRGGVPSSGVGAVALNVTVTNPTTAAFLTVWPAGVTRPNAANLNFTASQTVPNMVIVKLGDGGKISMFTNAGSADVIVDVLGWFPTGPGYTGLTPARLMDTRLGNSTIDGVEAGSGALHMGTNRDLVIAGRGGVPSAGVGAVALNVTVTNPTAAAFLTVWPSGVGRPNAANLNFTGRPDRSEHGDRQAW